MFEMVRTLGGVHRRRVTQDGAGIKSLGATTNDIATFSDSSTAFIGAFQTGIEVH